MPEPLRSPKQSRLAAKTRSHPYTRPSDNHRTRDVAIERSNSLLGAIKSFVTAPLAWLSLGEAQASNDSPQKRRMSGVDRGGTPPDPKRTRRGSPEVLEAAYLDPPSSMFPKRTAAYPPRNVASSEPPARTMSVDQTVSVVEPVNVPLPPSRDPSVLSRTSMSVEPQDTMNIRRSISRDFSMPPPSPFARSYTRYSLTPQPVGATFGPSPKRRTRESTAPPLLGSSTPKPTFTRPPTNTRQQTLFPRAPSKERSDGPISSLLWPNRLSVSPTRESSSQSMLVSEDSSVSLLSSKNSAERTLYSLESFRTPLHDSRFLSAPSVDALRPRKVHVPIPSKLRFDHTPDGKKEKTKRAPSVIGPYSSGMSGMRKLLARRREELQKEAEAEEEMDSKRDHSQTGPEASDIEVNKAEPGTDKGKDKADEPQTENVSELGRGRGQANGVPAKTAEALTHGRSLNRSKADSYSSLRTPSSRVNRTHASAPKLKKTRNKFSLDDDDDQQLNMSVDELKDYQTQIKPHISFTNVTRRMSETGMQTDTSVDATPRTPAVLPSLPAQPQTFDSLLSRIGQASRSAASKPAAEFPVETSMTVESTTKAQVQPGPSSEASSAPAVLPFSFGTLSAPVSITKPTDAASSPFSFNTPKAAQAPTRPAPVSTEAGVPSFFANSKMQFTPPKIPSSSLFETPPSGEGDKATERPGVVPVASNEEKDRGQQASKELKPSPFGGINKPSIFASLSGPPSNATSSDNTSTNSTSNVSVAAGPANESAQAPKPTFSFATPSVNGTDATKSGIDMGTASNATTTTNRADTTKPGINIFDAASSTAGTSGADATKPGVSIFGAAGGATGPSGVESTKAGVKIFGAASGTAGPNGADAPKAGTNIFEPASSTTTMNGTDTTKPGINIFGAASNTVAFPTATQTKPAFSFSTPTSPSAEAAPAGKPEPPATAPPDALQRPTFSFGAVASAPSTEAQKSSFTFGSTGQAKAPEAPVIGAAKSPFSFGAAPSSPPPVDKKPAFTFGITPGANTFSSGTGSMMNTSTNGPTTEVPKPTFGGFGSAERPTTPSTPKAPADNGDGMELAADRMEESPTRVLEKKETPGLPLPQPSLFTGFGSGGPSSGTGTSFSFGQAKPPSTNTTFSFTPAKPAPATGFGFGQSTNTTLSPGFSFATDAAKTAGETPSAFGAPFNSAFTGSTSGSIGTPSFSFGQASTGTNASSFGQTQPMQENGAPPVPGSPSLFPQPASQPQTPPSFTFNVPTPAGTFGAPKAGSAVAPSPTSQPFQFGASSSSQPSQDQAGGAAAGNTMFTLGGAATPPRKVKGLPNRRAKRP